MIGHNALGANEAGLRALYNAVRTGTRRPPRHRHCLGKGEAAGVYSAPYRGLRRQNEFRSHNSTPRPDEAQFRGVLRVRPSLLQLEMQRANICHNRSTLFGLGAILSMRRVERRVAALRAPENASGGVLRFEC